MIIKTLQVKNFRSILDETIPLDLLTALVGRNGAGKSSFLRALELFYDPSIKVSEEDFYAEDVDQDIEIAVTFADLSSKEAEFFAAYIDNTELTVVRIFTLVTGRKSGAYHGMRLQNIDFSVVRDVGGKREITAAYNELRNNEKYFSLPSVRSADQALEELKKWEKDHVNECERLRDDGQFFGFTEVGQGYLGRYTRFILVPAVRDASDDATEKKGSCVTEIMDLVVRSVLANRSEITDFRNETQTKYRDLLDPSKLTELSTLQDILSQTLKCYAPDASVSLKWTDLAEINVPLPEAQVKLLEDGYESSVQRTGHGLQRAFILTMIQHLIAAREAEKLARISSDESGAHPDKEESHIPNLVLAIEEPELYQHPCRQRHMASVLFQLAQGSIPGVARETQVIYSTHAPLFVGLDRFDQIRLLRKCDYTPGKPKISKVARAKLDDVAEELWILDGKTGTKYTGDTLRPRMQAVMTPWMNEGFFSDIVVLVEGEGDRAAIIVIADSMGYNLESMGISVVPCMSKNNLDRPAIVFRRLSLKSYLVWDNDKNGQDSNPDENKRLLRLVGAKEEDWPVGVFDNYSCLDSNLECTLRKELTETVFDALLEQARNEFRMKKDQALKNPFVLRRVIENAAKQGHTSSTLKAIVEKILILLEQ